MVAAKPLAASISRRMSARVAGSRNSRFTKSPKRVKKSGWGMAVRAYIRSDPSRQSAPLSHREVGVASLGGCLLAVAMHWPLPLHLGKDIPKDVGDPLYEAWQLAWGGHALLSQPIDYFQANAYWPLRNSLAFADALVGYAPAGLIGDGLTAAVVRYNLIFLFAYALAFVGPYLLARELGVGCVGGAIAGAAFAYAPWRLEHDGHLNVISSGGIA